MKEIKVVLPTKEQVEKIKKVLNKECFKKRLRNTLKNY